MVWHWMRVGAGDALERLAGEQCDGEGDILGAVVGTSAGLVGGDTL